MAGQQSERARVMQALRTVPTDRDPITKGDFTLSEGTAGQRYEVATYQANRPIALKAGVPFDLSLVAFESKTSDGTGGDSETFTLANDLVDSEAIRDSVVVYVEGTGYVEPDAVDYAANEVDVTDPGTNNEVGIYYAAGDQTRIEVEKEAPNGTVEQLWSDDLGMVHRRDLDKEPLTLDFGLSDLQPIVPKDFRVNVYVNAPYEVGWARSIGGAARTATNALLDVPAKGAERDIEGLKGMVRADMARR